MGEQPPKATWASVHPLADGGILLIFERGEAELDIEIDADGDATCLETGDEFHRIVEPDKLAAWFGVELPE